MSTTRRRFLQSALGSSTLLALGGSVPRFLARTALAADASSAGDRILVVVQLSGGNDGLNTVVPYAHDVYGRARKTLRITAEQAIPVADGVGLHPQLTGFGQLLESGRLGIVQGIGYPNPDRSHFRSMDIWHSAQPQVAQPVDGWLGRYVNTLPVESGVPGLYLGGNELPLALVSRERAVPAVESLDSFRLQSENGAVALAALRELAKPARADEPLLAFMQRSTLAAYESSERLSAAREAAPTNVTYPGFGLAAKLRNIANLIDAGLPTPIYYVSLDGFDTHAGQQAAHAGLMTELGGSLQAFMDDLAERGHADRVLAFVFSEFGRRVDENASFGTDHGAAAPAFVVGPQAAPGLIGKHPDLNDLDVEGDLKFHTDFRSVYAALLDRWLGCDSQVVLGDAFAPAPILRG